MKAKTKCFPGIDGVRLASDKIAGMNQTLRDFHPANYIRGVDNDGYGYMELAVYRTPECGCRVIGNGTLQLPFTVLPCKAHKRAENIRRHLESIIGTVQCEGTNSVTLRAQIRAAKKALK